MPGAQIPVRGNVVPVGNDNGQGEEFLERFGDGDGFVLGRAVDNNYLEVFVQLMRQAAEEFGDNMLFIESGDDDGEERGRFVHAL